jgi:hypothetical protein
MVKPPPFQGGDCEFDPRLRHLKAHTAIHKTTNSAKVKVLVRIQASVDYRCGVMGAFMFCALFLKEC